MYLPYLSDFRMLGSLLSKNFRNHHLPAPRSLRDCECKDTAFYITVNTFMNFFLNYFLYADCQCVADIKIFEYDPKKAKNTQF